MTTRKNTATALKPSKKEARRKIAERLENALPELKVALGEKKFLNRVKKAAKILGEDFALLPAESEEPAATPAAPGKKVKTAKKVTPPKKAKAASQVKIAKKVKAAKKAPGTTAKQPVPGTENNAAS